MTCLDNAFLKPVNEVFARHRLNICQQKVGESLEEFLQRLKTLSAECNFRAVTAAQNQEAAIRDAFIAGLSSGYIRQRLLENAALELQAVFDKARSLDDAQRNVEIYSSRSAITPGTLAVCEIPPKQKCKVKLCSFCGRKRHAREDCPAKTCTCFVCGKKGHFAKVCRSRRKKLSCGQPLAVCKQKQRNVTTSYEASDDENVNVTVVINGVQANGLLDTGAKCNHLSMKFAKQANLTNRTTSAHEIELAVKGASVKTQGSCSTLVELFDRSYENVAFSIMDGLLWDVILGREFLKQHRSVNFNFGGPEYPLHLGVLEPLKAKPDRLFEHLTRECQPIAAKSRHYSRVDQEFIRNRVCQLLRDDVIEPSSSPWRAQLVIVKNEKHKKRMCSSGHRIIWWGGMRY